MKKNSNNIYKRQCNMSHFQLNFFDVFALDNIYKVQIHFHANTCKSSIKFTLKVKTYEGFCGMYFILDPHIFNTSMMYLKRNYGTRNCLCIFSMGKFKIDHLNWLFLGIIVRRWIIFVPYKLFVTVTIPEQNYVI